MIDKHLRLVLETPEGFGMNDSVAVTLKLAASGRRCFIDDPAARIAFGDGVRREIIQPGSLS